MIDNPALSYNNFLRILIQYDKIKFLACGDIQDTLIKLRSMDIDATAIDYDPKYKNTPNYVNKDFVFDDVDLDADLIVHTNIEKTYAVEFKSGTDVILIGDNDEHNGDCIPIFSADQIIKLYNVKKVYEKGPDGEDNPTHFFVYGKI